MVGSELEDLLVQSRGPDDEASPRQSVRGPDELRDGLVELAGADVQITKRVGRVPVEGLVVENAPILGNRLLQPAQTKELLSVSQRGRAIDGHWRDQPIVSNSIGGRNDRRCAAE